MADDPIKKAQDAQYAALLRNNEELEKQMGLLREEADLKKQLNEQRQEAVRLEAQLAATTDIEKQNEITTKITQAQKEISKSIEKQREQQDDLNKLRQKYGDITLKNLEDSKEETKELEKQKKLGAEVGNALEKAFKPLEKLGVPIGKIGDVFRKAAGVREDIVKMGDKLVEVGGKSNNKMFMKLGQSLQSVGASAGAAGVALAGLAVIIASAAIVAKVTSMAMSFEKLSRDLERSTGGLGDMQSQLMETSEEVALMGANSEDVSAAYKDLINNFSDFDASLPGINKKLTKATITFSKFGVATGDSTDMINFMTKAMNKSAEEAIDMTAEILSMGQSVSISASKMAENFKNLQGRLVLFGKEGTEVLRKFSAMAKATGLSVTELQGIVTKFDQFDTAAESVGQLNAVLGTQLSTIDMISMNDAERLEAMQREFRSRGLVMDQMDQHTQLFIAQALGMQDAAAAQKLIDMDPKQYAEYNKKMEENVKTQAALQKQAEDLVPLQEKFSAALNQVMLTLVPLGTAIMENIVEPLVTFIYENRQVIGGLLKAITIFGAFVLVAATVGAVLGSIGTAIAFMLNPITLLIAGITYVKGGFDALFNLLTRTGSPIYYDMPRVIGENFASMGEMASKAGDMLKSPIKALGGLWDMFHKEGSPELYELPQTFADNFASIEESVSGTMGSMTKFISIMKEFASLDYDGFVAVQSDGGSTSLVMGSDGIIKQMSEGRLQVDVKMPEISMPPIQVNVVVNDAKLKEVIKAVVHKTVGRAG